MLLSREFPHYELDIIIDVPGLIYVSNARTVVGCEQSMNKCISIAGCSHTYSGECMADCTEMIV